MATLQNGSLQSNGRDCLHTEGFPTTDSQSPGGGEKLLAAKLDTKPPDDEECSLSRSESVILETQMLFLPLVQFLCADS